MANTQIKLRRDTKANWTAVNPVLGAGEPALETDTLLFKFGDGTSHYNSLLYPTLYSTPTSASALTGTTLPLSLTNSSLTSVGTLTGLTVNGNVTVNNPYVITGTITYAQTAGTAASASTATSATTAATAATITGPVGGTNNALTYLKSNGSVGFVPDPTATGSGVFLEWNGSSFTWATAPAAAASTLSGATLASNILNSSLTRVGTIATGVWNGTPVGISYGGTGATSAAAALIALGAAPAAGSTSITTIGALTSLTISGTADATTSNNVQFGSIITAGGINVAKSAYVSGNLFVGGVNIKSLALVMAAALG